MAHAHNGSRNAAAASARSASMPDQLQDLARVRTGGPTTRKQDEPAPSDLIDGVFDSSDMIDWVFSIFDDD